jgi:hypothetical protein
MNLNPYSFCYENIGGSQMYYKNHIDMSRQCPTPLKYAGNLTMHEDRSMIDNLLLLIKDQHGCRMIQKKLEEKNPDFMLRFLDKIKNNLLEIICDQFGNYVVQKYVESCSDKIIISQILEKLRPKLFQISINSYGTRGFQRLLDFISTEADFAIVKEFLVKNVYNLIQDVNGNHVIQKILQIYPQDKNSFIIKEIIQNIIETCQLKQGGCIFTKSLEKANDENKKEMIIKILNNIDKIVNDEHGNFIIQHILNLKIEEFNDIIFSYVKSNIINLSKQKYSSNVIDKCILFEDSELRSSLIDKLIELKCIPELIVDQYGNYGQFIIF